jgi:uncharacterized protein with GYD domain
MVFSHVILIDIADAVEDVVASTHRLVEVLDQLTDGETVPGVETAQLFAVSGGHDFVCLLQAEEVAAVVAAVAFKQAGPATVHSMAVISEGTLAQANLILPNIHKTGGLLHDTPDLFGKGSPT